MIKSNNLLNTARAMQEALGRGGEEALMLNQAGEVRRCAQSNVFIVTAGALVTPPVEAGLLPGITPRIRAGGRRGPAACRPAKHADSARGPALGR